MQLYLLIDSNNNIIIQSINNFGSIFNNIIDRKIRLSFVNWIINNRFGIQIELIAKAFFNNIWTVGQQLIKSIPN